MGRLLPEHSRAAPTVATASETTRASRLTLVTASRSPAAREQAEEAAEADKEDTLENLTPFERQMMMKHRISWLFWEIAHASHSVCRVKRLLELCSGDATLMMSFFGLAGTFNNLFAMIISPLIGSLSDAYGRKYIVAAGRLGTALFEYIKHLAVVHASTQLLVLYNSTSSPGTTAFWRRPELGLVGHWATACGDDNEASRQVPEPLYVSIFNQGIQS